MEIRYTPSNIAIGLSWRTAYVHHADMATDEVARTRLRTYYLCLPFVALIWTRSRKIENYSFEEAYVRILRRTATNEPKPGDLTHEESRHIN